MNSKKNLIEKIIHGVFLTMTEKLYYSDSYIKEFEACVISCEKIDERYAVVLDKTAFFPEEGGQYSDKGLLGGARMLDAQERDGIIYHYVDSPLTSGERVKGVIDFAERYDKMQCHTAEHILSGLIHKIYGLDNVGFHLGRDDVTMDVSSPLSWESLIEIERLANEAVYANVTVSAIYPTSDELKSLSYRSKLDITENVRIINIGEYDSCACCAPHVRRTGEIGLISILDAEKLRGGMRIHIAAGGRAYRIYRKMYENLARISHALSVPRLNTADAVAKTLSDLEEKKNEYKAARIAYFEREADLIETTSGNLVMTFADATQDELRALANKSVNKVSGILVLLSGTDGEYKYLMASQNVDLKSEIKKINAALMGRGGGSSVMVQGSFCATLEEIEKYFI